MAIHNANIMSWHLTPQFTIRHWAYLITALAAFLGLQRLLEPKAFFAICGVVHGVTPILAAACFAGLRGSPLATRIAACVLTAALSTGVMVVLTTASYGADSVGWVFVAMLVEWPGQIPLAIALFWMGFSRVMMPPSEHD